MAFEENAEELKKNFASLGFDLNGLSARKKILIDHVFIERSEIEETGEYDLEGLFIRLGHAIDSIGAKRVVLDTIEALFSGLSNTSILRAELRRLFRWLKDKGVTAIITGRGIKLLNVYLQPEGLLMGTARMQKEAQERAASMVRQQETGRREREFELKRKTLEGQIAALQAELGSQEEEFRNFRLQQEKQQDMEAQEKEKMAGLRKAD